MRTGITFIAFDHLHAGYISMLEEAKSQCDYLIVGLQTNPNNKKDYKVLTPKSLVERYIQLNACKYVDEIVPYITDQDLEDIMCSFNIDVRIIGEEYKGKNFTAKSYCLKKGIEIYYNKR
ncbi:adenylyltransferase/cytidyltransferase family protein [Myroides marinus]|uniref:adenylyltransferase/cytidyltransferase family protein n=1 Tax=Myroides marinus TaxID=703342 RepID=UPI0025786EFD|nr:adenylyltransferase/cytidyltransferase family protein [Myroides marinus]MDM1370219.1 adenylyltransferase/cytidyltransferase family protein [Myroides marinus]MDM1391407.1 adenylyltransferase/cytidyltransferase family protein [Myroides marinus]MDM1534408.1 adenylyltransferase/cytidyltransferase family protein [Myroides marinus]MDM1541372.1 adenylyltransferase/cytidyltransferase family protein [Myroides marinus]